MPKYKFRIEIDVTVEAENRSMAERCARGAKVSAREGVPSDWPAKVTAGRSRLVSVARKKPVKKKETWVY